MTVKTFTQMTNEEKKKAYENFLATTDFDLYISKWSFDEYVEEQNFNDFYYNTETGEFLG